jgi:hypothetical protein
LVVDREAAFAGVEVAASFAEASFSFLRRMLEALFGLRHSEVVKSF